ncbi:MAG: TolC family outer membrane protein [Ottowia sp.]|uniref:TolC family outer membrane protein n=1 Tax=Ottowia sp. TaxID=1898956 RepID=UPI003C72B871
MNADLLKSGLRCAVASLIVSLLSHSFDAEAMDLSTAVERAKSNDPIFQAARLQRDALAEKLPQALSSLRPSIHLRAGANKQSGHAAFGDDPHVARSASSSHWSIQLTQVIWNRSLKLGVDQADAQVRLAEEQFRLAEQDLLVRVTQAYLEAGIAKENTGVITAQTKAVCEQLTLAERNFDAGLSTITDVHEARSRRDLVEAQQASAQIELENKTAELERILGDSPLEPKRLDHGQPLPKIELSTAFHWIDEARHQAPQVRLQQLQAEIAGWELQRAKAAHGPTLELTASYGGNRSHGSLATPADIASRSRSAQMGLQLNIPLYSGGLDSRTREAALLHQKADQDLEAARRAAATAARQALSALQNGQSQVAALTSAVAASRASLESNRVGYRIGTRINVDVLNAQQQLFAAERDLYRARVDSLLAGLRLKAATGSLGNADLAAIDSLLISSAQ